MTGREVKVWVQEDGKRSESVGIKRLGREVKVWGQEDRMRSESVGTRGQDE